MTPSPVLPAAGTAPPTPAGLSPLDEPTFEECVIEWNSYHDAQAAGMQIDPDGTHGNQFVAFYAGRIVGYGNDQLALRKRVAAELNVHPARLVIDYPWMWPPGSITFATA